MLARTLDVLLSHPAVAAAWVVLSADDAHFTALGYAASKPVHALYSGGATRAHSVLAGLDALARSCDADTEVLVHDAARPLLTREDLDALLAPTLDEHGAALASPLADTLRRGEGPATQLRAAGSVPRAGLWVTHTPQRARLDVLRGALQSALAAGREPTDELEALELAGYRPRLVPGRRDNFKITAPEDLELAAALIAARGA